MRAEWMWNLNSPAQDLGHAAVGDAQLARDVAGPDSLPRQLHDLVAHQIGQRAPVHEVAAQLIDARAAVACLCSFGSVGRGRRDVGRGTRDVGCERFQVLVSHLLGDRRSFRRSMAVVF